MSKSNQIMLSDMWPLMAEQIEAGKSVKFQPGGRSMLPMVRPGVDTVLLKKAPEKLKKYDLPLYLTEEGQFILHRVIKVSENVYTICGDNCWKKEENIKHSQILAVAEGFWRDNEYIPCTDKKYLHYCRNRVLRQRMVRAYFRTRHFAGRILRRLGLRK